jgi:eukaryotic-like serine/threonine-protein kinase
MFPLTTTKLLAPLVLLCVILQVSCNKSELPQDGSKEIISYSLKRSNGTAFSAGELSVSVQGNIISITTPAGTNLNGLIPEISIKGRSISPASGVPQNFNMPVIYTVTAADGTTASYTVTVQAAIAPPSEGMIYMGSSDKNFYALDVTTGTLKWKYTGTASFAYSSATYADGTVYVGGVDSYVYAFDALTGNVKWKYQAGTTGIESDAVVVDGTVYVGCNDDYLLALNATTGQLKWSFPTGGNISASPTISNAVVYFGSSDGKLYALQAATGQLKWSFATGAMINQSGPALVDGVIYVGSRDSYLYAIDVTTGTQKWRYYTNGISLEQSSPTVANGVVYIGGWYDVPAFSMKGSLYAVNTTTGQLVWEKMLNTGIGSSPTVAAGKLYITADDNNLHALDAATGTTLWTKQILANGASAGVSNGVVYVGGGGTRAFYAFDANTGAEKWRFAMPNGLMTSSPLIVTATKVDYSGDSGILQ